MSKDGGSLANTIVAFAIIAVPAIAGWREVVMDPIVAADEGMYASLPLHSVCAGRRTRTGPDEQQLVDVRSDSMAVVRNTSVGQPFRAPAAWTRGSDYRCGQRLLYPAPVRPGARGPAVSSKTDPGSGLLFAPGRRRRIAAVCGGEQSAAERIKENLAKKQQADCGAEFGAEFEE